MSDISTRDEVTTRSTYHLNYEHDVVQRFVDEAVTDRAAPPVELAIQLHNAVRDGIRYEVYDADLTPEGTRASAIIERGQGFCVHKSIVYAAACRAVGIPARLVYGDVRNHLASERLIKLMGGSLFTYHALNSVYLDGTWLKATPVFNTLLCRLYRIKPLEFDGRTDSLYHPFDVSGRRHMEFVRWRGEFDDFPYQQVVSGIAENHPLLVGPDLLTQSGSLVVDAANEQVSSDA
jgi:transglutaminase-like putative cysteine protease